MQGLELKVEDNVGHGEGGTHIDADVVGIAVAEICDGGTEMRFEIGDVGAMFEPGFGP